MNATITSRTITSTSHLITIGDEDVEVPFEVDCMVDPFLSEDGNTLRYAVLDDSGHDHEWQEGVEFFTGDTGSIHYVDADEANERLDALRETHDVFVVDVYQHGNVVHSLSSEGPQCQFDTARGGAAIAIPTGPEGFTNPREAAASILTEYSAWCNGEVYGIVEMQRDPATGEWAETDSTCWGFIGYEYAEQMVKEGY